MPGKGREGLPQMEGLRLRPPRVLGGRGTALPECLWVILGPRRLPQVTVGLRPSAKLLSISHVPCGRLLHPGGCQQAGPTPECLPRACARPARSWALLLP